MRPTLPKYDPTIEKLVRECALCQRRVIDATDGRGGRLVIEFCAAGAGTHGLVAPLIPGERVEAVKSGGTRYRRHDCPGTRAFSADARAPKRRCLLVGGQTG